MGDTRDKCGAVLVLWGDHKEDTVTFICQREIDHEGLHREQDPEYDVSWAKDQRVPCDECGLLLESPLTVYMAKVSDAPFHLCPECLLEMRETKEVEEFGEEE